MLSFEEFRAVNNRDKNKANSVKDLNPSQPRQNSNNKRNNNTKDELKLPATSPSSTWRESLGEFLELHSFQSIVAALIVVDTFGSFCDIALQLNHFDGTFIFYIRSMRTLSSIIILLFAIEIFMIYIAFGLKSITHIGYLLDFILIFSQIFLDANGYGREGRLLNILRIWRLVRLLGGVIGLEREKQEILQLSVDRLNDAVKELELEKASSQQELNKEQEARRAVETMLLGYKEEVDTLNEALRIAAMDIAEAGGNDTDGGSDIMSDLDDKEVFSVRSEMKADAMRAVLEQRLGGAYNADQDDTNTNDEASIGRSSVAETARSSTFLIHEDGKFEMK